MNLYLLEANMSGLDVYVSAVVAENNAAAAKLIHPSGDGTIYKQRTDNDWPRSVQQISCKAIGTTKVYKAGEVVHSSFVGF